ncbi:MAG: hypothetical protein JXA78_02850 [Anaerolineales bacterium]|nr:hypothetical protein [Anaerolineales bacterium]
MKLKNWMIAKAIVVLIFGVGFVLIPNILAGLYGMNLDPAATLMARLFGGGFIFEAVVLWFARNTDRDDVACRGIMLGVVVSNLIGFIVCLLATLAGTWNALGWLSVALFLVFGLAFAYFRFVKK